ncbi:hypothetical protein AVEN_127606-1 [Araneus ventricosus]|uniref:Uncharacterized protein n=1 Tax=Araneus ventricosus TaxID=182803 RepID=A0A4Y2EQG5_ARAVE|nr:hypothetical protein AVEN_127606-1 [Araneus ventricosus]
MCTPVGRTLTPPDVVPVLLMVRMERVHCFKNLLAIHWALVTLIFSLGPRELLFPDLSTSLKRAAHDAGNEIRWLKALKRVPYSAGNESWPGSAGNEIYTALETSTTQRVNEFQSKRWKRVPHNAGNEFLHVLETDPHTLKRRWKRVPHSAETIHIALETSLHSAGNGLTRGKRSTQRWKRVPAQRWKRVHTPDNYAGNESHTALETRFHSSWKRDPLPALETRSQQRWKRVWHSAENEFHNSAGNEFHYSAGNESDTALDPSNEFHTALETRSTQRGKRDLAQRRKRDLNSAGKRFVTAGNEFPHNVGNKFHTTLETSSAQCWKQVVHSAGNERVLHNVGNEFCTTQETSCAQRW